MIYFLVTCRQASTALQPIVLSIVPLFLGRYRYFSMSNANSIHPFTILNGVMQRNKYFTTGPLGILRKIRFGKGIFIFCSPVGKSDSSLGQKMNQISGRILANMRTCLPDRQAPDFRTTSSESSILLGNNYLSYSVIFLSIRY